MGAGKSTFGELLRQECQAVNTYAFADPIKEDAVKLDEGIKEIVEDIGWDEAKRHSPYVRGWLQEYSKGKKAKDLYYFPRLVVPRMLEEKTAIITDLRFFLELDYVLSLKPHYQNGLRVVVVWMKRDTNEANNPALLDESEKLTYNKLARYRGNLSTTGFDFDLCQIPNHMYEDDVYEQILRDCAKHLNHDYKSKGN